MSLFFSEEGKPIMNSRSSKAASLDSLKYWDISITEAYEGFVNKKSSSIDTYMVGAEYNTALAQPDLKIRQSPIISASYNGQSLNPYINY